LLPGDAPAILRTDTRRIAMFCPHCRYEYLEGIKTCPDCGAELVAELPPENEPEYIELVTVFKSDDTSALLLARSLLEGEEIPFFPKGDGIADLFAAGRIGFNPVVGSIEIQVRVEDKPRALEILAELEE
jgi:hypothetical protein